MPSSESGLPRAASYTYLPNVDDKIFEESQVLEVKESLGEDGLLDADGLGQDTTSTSTSGGSSPDIESQQQANDYIGHRESQTISTGGKNALPKLDTASRGTAEHDEGRDQATPIDRFTREPSDEDFQTPRSISRTLSQRLREQSWLPGSRSPSPKKRDQSPKRSESTGKGLFGAGRRNSGFLSKSTPVIEISGKEGRSRSSSLSRKGTVLGKKLKRPMSSATNGAASQNVTPAEPQSRHSFLLPKSFSSEKLPLPSVLRSQPSSERIPPLPRTGSMDKIKGVQLAPRKKDELWTVFRTLESEVERFHSKPTGLKANVVRNALLPFLRNYKTHKSDHRLRLEDLDRRAKILNLWWTGLLELLHGKSNQAISPSDRPSIYDAIIGIMERPEWRLPPSQFSALKDRSNPSLNSRSASSSSLASEASDFLTDSVNHNVRNIFIQNLLSQMTFVVDKMSERQTPATTVSFCGKTCAYAFFFCSDIADILVRLWSPSIDLLFRVITENGFGRNTSFEMTSNKILSVFPPSLKALQLTTVPAVYKRLKPAVKPPLGTEHVDWTGYWTKRWSGRESDLFYVFAKHFHLLAVEFLPEDPTKRERLCAPGLIFVHAQLLSNIDATIHRQMGGPEAQQAGSSTITFDDVLSDVDAAAPGLPVAPLSNANRIMAENRIIMLVRDMLSDRSQHPVAARQIFAEGFSDLLKAAAKRTSMYNQGACYTLCDFLEEVLVLLVRYEQADGQNACFDWSFWLQVWRKMAESHNTSTEIRLYSLIFGLWQSLVADPLRKRKICFEFLLEPEFFHSRFNHWCPLVRAYFMRLLCWRISRFDGESHSPDIDIYETLSERLRTVYCHFLYLRDEAMTSNKLLPSTAPSFPIPGRRLIIVLTDPRLARGPGSFLTLDGISSQHDAGFRPHVLSSVDLRPASASSGSDEGENELSPGKKFGFLRTIIGTSKQARTRSQSPARKDPLAKGRASSLPPAKPTTGAKNGEKDDSSSHSYQKCFRFSIEMPVQRRDLGQPPPSSPPQMRLFPPRLPLPAQQLLHTHSQSQIQSQLQSQSRFANTLNELFNAAPVSSAYGIDPTGHGGRNTEIKPIAPVGKQIASASYAGRALAEWALVVGECQAFFERRKGEGVPGNAYVETPTLGVEVFKRPI